MTATSIAELERAHEGVTSRLWTYFIAFHVAGPGGLNEFQNAEIKTSRPLAAYVALQRLQAQIAERYKAQDRAGRDLVGVQPRVTVISFQLLDAPLEVE